MAGRPLDNWNYKDVNNQKQDSVDYFIFLY